MKSKNIKRHEGSCGSGAVYGFGMIGAAIYFLQHASSFGDVVMGLLKAIVWPGMFVYKGIELLNL